MYLMIHTRCIPKQEKLMVLFALFLFCLDSLLPDQTYERVFFQSNVSLPGKFSTLRQWGD